MKTTTFEAFCEEAEKEAAVQAMDDLRRALADAFAALPSVLVKRLIREALEQDTRAYFDSLKVPERG